MEKYHSVKINQNSDCWNEINMLKELLRKNKHYMFKKYSNAEVIAITIDELYEKLIAEKKNNENQRKIQ